MTEHERRRRILSAINYWLPRSWADGGHRYRLGDLSLTGDEEDGGAELTVFRESEQAVVTFTNEECYGSPLSPNAARARVYGSSFE